MADADFIVLVWQGLMSNMTAMTEEKTEQQVKEVVLNWVKVRCAFGLGVLSPNHELAFLTLYNALQSTDGVLAEFTKGARTEIALM